VGWDSPGACTGVWCNNCAKHDSNPESDRYGPVNVSLKQGPKCRAPVVDRNLLEMMQLKFALPERP
jgi:hypothetical protein